ncbi:alpha/beta hydrolase family protein [Mesoplasma photuris]|uniref:alpha/beta hydrolase family protein n=1 Tax=Mesoplasma photuris TaxID=217731 RepID=UPI0004E1E4EC|nr:alpha/beta hydrolase [Mesoplasma photuris]
MGNKLGNKIFKSVHKSINNLYEEVESVIFSAAFKKKNVYLYPEINKMNKLMRNLYKKPQLQLFVTDNLLPINFVTEDGKVINGLQYITNLNSKKWIIVSHWFGSHKYWSLYWAKPFIELGYNILVFDFRNHGDSEKDEVVTLGINEQKDLKAAIEWLSKNHKYDVLGLMGISMGAFVTNNLMNNSPEIIKKNKIKFVISDSAYKSVESLLLHSNVFTKKWSSVQRINNKIKKAVDNQLKENGIDWRESKINYEFKNMVPTLFVHGENDNVTSFGDSLETYILRKNMNINDDDIIIYNFSSHCNSLKEHYYQNIYNWLMFENKIIKNDETTQKALIKLGITEEIIDNNFEEKHEVITFSLKNKREIKNG